MKRNEKCQKTPKNKEYRNNWIVSAFVHHEEILGKYLISRLKNLEISVNEKPDVKIQNIVASSDFKKELKLRLLAEALMSENVEYEPEQFPGLVYRMDNLGVVLLLFSSGKLVCTGAESLEDVNNAIDTVKDKLTSLGVL